MPISTQDIKDIIKNELNEIITHLYFRDWLNDTNVQGNSLLMFNNSFLFRANFNTKKSVKYLSCVINPDKTIDLNQIIIVEGITMNKEFKIINRSAGNFTETTIENEITSQITNIGELVFVLVGKIEDTIEITRSFSNQIIKKIVLKPSQTEQIIFDANEVWLRDTIDRELIYNEIVNHLNSVNSTIPNKLNEQVDKVLNDIDKDAYYKVTIPTTFSNTEKYVLDRIVDIVNEHINTYQLHLPNISTDRHALNEILRISYNFVSDMTNLIELIINVCDLKPLILWMTVSKHFKLDYSFKNLPWGYSYTKPSLKTYEEVIKKSRNKTFHQLFPFQKTFELEISSGLQDTKLRFFSDYTNKNDNRLEFKDKKLADLLLNFTRVSEKTVSDNFWIENIAVMEAINNIFLATSQTIKGLR